MIDCQSWLIRQEDIMSNFLAEESKKILSLIERYRKTWEHLLAYDEGRLELPDGFTGTTQPLDYKLAIHYINMLKQSLNTREQASNLFGKERNGEFQSILQNLEQTFDGKALYASSEEKAAHLLYFVIKDHPFVDGNKRIGSFLFLLYLTLQNISDIALEKNGLTALSLFIAESPPSQKNMVIRLIVNLII